MNGGLSEWQQAHSLGMSTKNTSKCRPKSTRLFVPVPTHEPVKAKNIPVDETTNMIPLREFNIGLAAGISRKQIASNDQNILKSTNIEGTLQKSGYISRVASDIF